MSLYLKVPKAHVKNEGLVLYMCHS